MKELGMKHIDALIITEIKLDSLFPTSELLSKGFSEPFRLGWNRDGGRVTTHVGDDIPRDFY